MAIYQDLCSKSSHNLWIGACEMREFKDLGEDIRLLSHMDDGTGLQAEE